MPKDSREGSGLQVETREEKKKRKTWNLGINNIKGKSATRSLFLSTSSSFLIDYDLVERLVVRHAIPR